MPKTRILTVTPAMAKKWLKGALPNRTIRRAAVIRFMCALAQNRWKLDGSTIKFDLTGRLTDGQHRLAAIAESGISAKCNCFWSSEEGIPLSIDTNTPRSLPDILKLRGEEDPTSLAAAIRYTWRVKVWNSWQDPMGNFRKVADRHRSSVAWSKKVEEEYSGRKLKTRDERVINWLQYIGGARQKLPCLDHESAIRWLDSHGNLRAAVKLSKLGMTKNRILPPGIAAALAYLFAEKSREDATEFFTRLNRGTGLKANDPILALREKMLASKKGSGERLLPYEVAAYAIKAWNAYRKGQRVKALSLKLGGKNKEPFPVAA